MLVVTGTKRSGTSLWMQLLVAAGYSFVGNQFPRNWEEKLQASNPRGFYESELRKGIYWETNPHPVSGRYLRPEATRELLVKVFVPGLVRSDVAFLDRVVATIRPWRDMVHSIRKMRAAEAEVFGWGEAEKVPAYLPPEVEWLKENFLLIRDVRVRQYPTRVVAHGELMREPRAVIERVLGFLGGPMDKVDTLVAQVDTGLHRHRDTREVSTVIDDEVIGLLDTWMACVDRGAWDDIVGLTALNDAWKIALENKWFDLKLRWDDPRVQGSPAAGAT